MTDIFYNDGTNVMDPNNPKKILSYHIDKKMLSYLKKIKDNVNKKDKDWVTLIDGYEGAGKSTFGQQIGRYLDPTLDISRVCMTADEFKQAIINATKGQCVIYDEAVTGMTSGDSITRVGKLLKSMMMQMRQKNLFVIVILPSIFELSKYAVLSRARSFFHIYESGGRMGYWIGFNKKATRLTFLKGKKTHSYKVKSYFSGRFFGKYPINEKEYRKKKEEALFMIDEDPKKLTWTDKKHILGFKVACGILKRHYTLKELEKEFKNDNYPISHAQIGKNVAEIEEILGKRQDFSLLPPPNTINI